MKYLFPLRGFTLVELMIVVAVIAILATIALFGLGRAQEIARDTQRQQVMNGIRAALQKYNGDNAAYPTGVFTAMMNSLSTGGQMTAPPIDPGCGSGKQTYTNGGLTGGQWAPCGTALNLVSYSYVAGGGVYSLVLFREGGGSNTFIGVY